MTITNGYTTREIVKERLLEQHTYSAATLAFVAATKRVNDTALGLKRFTTGSYVTISGSTNNNGTFLVASGDVPTHLSLNGTVTDEAAGSTVTITDVSSPIDDATIDAVVTAVSRLIDNHCHRRFYRNTSDEIRYYTTQWSDMCFTDDIGSVTSLKTDEDGDRTYETTWTTADYDLCPANAAADGEPYTYLELAPDGDYSFPSVRRGVYICGKFGFSATAPGPVQEACILQTVRLFKRKDLPFGIAGSADMGQLMALVQLDPDVKLLLQPYIRIFAP